MTGQQPDHHDFRAALGSLASGVSVVTCVNDGFDHAMTASAVMSVSLEPQLIAVGVARTARFWSAIHSQRHWAVSILGGAARDHASWLATSGRPLQGQLHRIPHSRGAHGVALIDDALAWIECETKQVVTAGDHDLFIAKVHSARLGPAQSGLVYWRSQYRHLGDPIPDPTA